MNFEDLLAEFDPSYNIQMVDCPMSPDGPLSSQMFKLPEYSLVASDIQKKYPNGIYLMKWEQESKLPGDLGTVGFVRFRGIK